MKKSRNFILTASFVVLMALAITVTIQSLTLPSTSNTQATPAPEISRDALLYP